MASGWHRNDDDWVQHPKVDALQRLLNEPLADAYVERLRCWTGRFRVRGRFGEDVVGHLEKLCGWSGEPGKLLAAFVVTGIVDERSRGQYEVHDWWEKQGALVEKAEKDAARKRRYRAKKSTDEDADASADGHADVPRDGAGTRRDETRRDETRRDETRRDGDLFGAPAPPKERVTKPDRPQPDPRHAPLVAELVKVFAEENPGAEYPFSGRDAKAVADLLKLGIEPTIVAAWRNALRAAGYPLVRTLPELVTHFAHFVARRGPIDHDAERQAAHAREAGGQPF